MSNDSSIGYRTLRLTKIYTLRRVASDGLSFFFQPPRTLTPSGIGGNTPAPPIFGFSFPLTTTRGVSGFCGEANHSAKAVRRPVEFSPAGGVILAGVGSMIERTPGSTSYNGFVYTPTESTLVGGA